MSSHSRAFTSTVAPVPGIDSASRDPTLVSASELELAYAGFNAFI